jgi:hypothetical protein
MHQQHLQLAIPNSIHEQTCTNLLHKASFTLTAPGLKASNAACNLNRNCT